jgi:NTE family protein
MGEPTVTDGRPLPGIRQPRTAVVFSGGGARGAYEAGILRFLRNDLARQLGYQPQIDIVTGTSVGAINACYLAATAEEPERQGAMLCRLWQSLHVEDLISLKLADILRAGRVLLGRDPAGVSPTAYRYGGLLETSGLERLVLRGIPWRGIRRNLVAGRLQALTVSATHVGSGHTVVFIDSGAPVPQAWSRDPAVRHRAAAIGPRHALASASIPMLFPAVRIDQAFYTDGGLRQNTPLSPAIRLGADRILVISLRHVATPAEALELAAEREHAYPKPFFLLGKALNALLLDHTDYDLDRMARFNAIIEAGTSAFGPLFETVLSRELIRLRGAPLRPIQAVHIRPSADIGGLAARFLRSGGLKLRGRTARRAADWLVQAEAAHESDLLSYLLFDGGFATELIALGHRDAAAKADELAALFAREVPVAAAAAAE